ncbi:MAG: DUF429 domain-containing protein [Phycisphaerales bacterium]|nr:MAG: DUF429 domain-containing protein [Phycisphaerales bacterium]
MSVRRSFDVAGVDGCRGGWLVAIATVTVAGCRAGRISFELKRLVVAGAFAELLTETVSCRMVCVDIPIGLSEGPEPRQCDVAARRLLGRQRASSVFPPPLRQCLTAADYRSACRICTKYSARKLSRQSYLIMDKIAQVDGLMTAELQNRVREVHPEVSFQALNANEPLHYSKRSPAGRRERMDLLARVFSNVEDIVASGREAGRVASDDILDSLVAAWTAGRAVTGRVVTLPDSPEPDGKGLRMEILYPQV